MGRVLAALVRTHRAIRARSVVGRSEVALVACALLVVQAVVFHGYYRGSASPGGDFLGVYNNEAFAWWRDGGILHPPSWMPYVWGGYPAAASIQNSSWYLPAGLASLFGLDLHAAAVLQALHVALGGLGAYVLGRRAGFGRFSAMLGLVAYSLTSGVFSNAPYIDIARGYALAPWILLCLSPLWPWRRPWSIPLAVLLLWQAAVGIYPGMLVALAYGGAMWLIVWQVARRPRLRDLALPLAVSGLLAALLSLPKYLPLLSLQTVQPGVVEDLSVFTRATLGTFVLPGYAELPGVYSLNSYFVPAAVVLLALVASWRATAVRAALGALAVAVVFSLPVPVIAQALNALPGIGISRFRQNDFRVLVTLMLVVGAMAGWSRLIDSVAGWRPGKLALPHRVVLVMMVPVMAAVFLLFGHFRRGDWVPTTVVLALTSAVVLAVLVLAERGRLDRVRAAVGSVAVIVLAGASGLAYGATTRDIWSIDSVQVQRQMWGATSGELIDHRSDTQTAVQRPARSTVPEDASQTDVISPDFNSAYYTGFISVGGYLNVHNSPSFVQARQALADPAPDSAEAARAFLAAPGIVVGGGLLPSADQTATCVATGDCVGSRTTPVSYAPGSFVYDLAVPADTRLVANEASYPGWSILLIDVYGHTFAASPLLGPAGMLAFDVPAGLWRLSMVYETPHASLGAEVAGISLGATLAIWLALGWSRRRPRITATGNDGKLGPASPHSPSRRRTL